MISIWFFIGLLLLAYGVVILSASVYEVANPPAHEVVLANLHPGIYWGAMLLILGLIYSIRFRPGKGDL